MKTLIYILIVILSTTFAYANETNPIKGISGLEITTYKTKKLGIHIYIISEYYSEKKVEFIDKNGKVVYTKNTAGAPIQLSKIKAGNYMLKITENDKSATVYYEIH